MVCIYINILHRSVYMYLGYTPINLLVYVYIFVLMCIQVYITTVFSSYKPYMYTSSQAASPSCQINDKSTDIILI